MERNNNNILGYDSLVERFKKLIFSCGDGKEIHVFDASSDYGVELDGSSIDKISIEGEKDIYFYYNENTNDCDELHCFSIEELNRYFEGLKEYFGVRNIDGIMFYLNDYHSLLKDFDFISDVVKLGVKEEDVQMLPLIITDGFAYCDVPNIGRVKWHCMTDDEWMRKCEPSKFDLYCDMEECGINRWQIWYVTQNGMVSITPSID